MKTTTYNLLQVRIAPIVMDQLTNLSYISGISKQDLARMALAEFLEKKTEKSIFNDVLTEVAERKQLTK
jgi:hypothetical protein